MISPNRILALTQQRPSRDISKLSYHIARSVWDAVQKVQSRRPLLPFRLCGREEVSPFICISSGADGDPSPKHWSAAKRSPKIPFPSFLWLLFLLYEQQDTSLPSSVPLINEASFPFPRSIFLDNGETNQ